MTCRYLYKKEKVHLTGNVKMESCDENKPLLINTGKDSSNHTENKDVRSEQKTDLNFINYITLCFVTISLGCSAELGSAQVIPQYVYNRLKEADNLDNLTNHIVSDYNSSHTGDLCGNNTKKSEGNLQGQASQWMLYLKLVEDGMELFGLSVFGACSDFIGRKPLIILCLLGTTLRYGGIALIIEMKFHINFLFIPYGLAGLIGNASIFYLAMFSIIADRTNKTTTRTLFLALFDLVKGIGVAGAQIAAGYLIRLMGYLFPLLLATGLCFINIIPAIVFIPETGKVKPAKVSVPTIARRLTSFYHDKSVFTTKSRWRYFVCLAALLFHRIAYYPGVSIDTLYELGHPFCWSSESVGYFSAATTFLQLVVGIGLIKLFHRCFSDQTIAMVGCLSAVAYRVLTAFANNGIMLYIAAAVGLMTITPLPILRSIMSRMVYEDQQGSLFANIYIIEVICKLSSTSIFNSIYSATQGFMSGFVFFVMAGFYLISSLFFIPLIISRDISHQTTEHVVQA